MKMRREEYEKKNILFRAWYYTDPWDDLEWRPSSIALSFATSIVVVILVSIFIVNHLGAPAWQAEIDQVRKDLAVLDICDTDTRDKLIDLNVSVRTSQKYNRIFIIGLFVPDSWDEMEVIDIPSRDCRKQTVGGDLNLNVTGIDPLVGTVK